MTLLLVTDLKQYLYCPRIVYYAYCLPHVRPVTAKMQAGRDAHLDEEGREHRRSLRAYGLADGEREFNVWLESVSMGLRGRLDMAIRVPPPHAEAIPVEYKDSARRAGEHWIMQVVAYGELLAEATGLPVRRGFLYSIPGRRSEPVTLTPARRAKLRQTVQAIREMIEHERMPDPPVSRRPCLTCEFRRFCNDV